MKGFKKFLLLLIKLLTLYLEGGCSPTALSGLRSGLVTLSQATRERSFWDLYSLKAPTGS